jgi:hypothetical protein
MKQLGGDEAAENFHKIFCVQTELFQSLQSADLLCIGLESYPPIHEIRGSHGADYECYCFQGCDRV